MTSLRDLDSSALLDRFGELVHQDHHVTAGMLCCIAEIDRRQLWAQHGYSSMFKFCVEGFRMSESMAGKRIHATRTMRRLPLVGEMVARGELHLSGICLLAKHLTQDNHRDVLARARHRSIRELEKLVAEIHPRPDAPSRVRRVPRRKAASPSDGHATGAPADLFSRNPNTGGEKPNETVGGSKSRSRPEPLSPQRYRIGMTVGEATHDKLAEAQALLSHRVPSNDVAIVFDLALDSLLDKLRKERTGAASSPRGSQRAPRNTKGRTRHVPAHVRRAVWKRDGSRCAYVSPAGRRCTETRWLELHHREPYARGGQHTVDGIELRCRPHNQYQANLDFGRAFMDRKRRGSGARETLAPYVRCA